MHLNVKKFIHKSKYIFVESTGIENTFKDLTVCYYCDKENLYITVLLKHPREKNNDRKEANRLVSIRMDDYMSGKSDLGITIPFDDFIDYIYDKEAWDVSDFDMLNELVDKIYIKQNLDFSAIKTQAVKRVVDRNFRIEEKFVKLISKLKPSILKK